MKKKAPRVIVDDGYVEIPVGVPVDLGALFTAAGMDLLTTRYSYEHTGARRIYRRRE
jgi:hypothetical protein